MFFLASVSDSVELCIGSLDHVRKTALFRQFQLRNQTLCKFCLILFHAFSPDKSISSCPGFDLGSIDVDILKVNVTFFEQEFHKLCQELGSMIHNGIAEAINGRMIRCFLTLKQIVPSGIVNAEVFDLSCGIDSFTIAKQQDFQHGHRVDYWLSAAIAAGA